MAITNITLGTTYTLITAATTFLAQNASTSKQEWARAATAPAESIVGLSIGPEELLESTLGNDNLYGKGGGVVVVIT